MITPEYWGETQERKIDEAKDINKNLDLVNENLIKIQASVSVLAMWISIAAKGIASAIVILCLVLLFR